MFILADFTCDYYPITDVKKTEVKKSENKKQRKHNQAKKNNKRKILTRELKGKTLVEKTVGIVPCSKGKILIMSSLVKNDIKSPINNGKCKTKKIINTTIRKYPRRG